MVLWEQGLQLLFASPCSQAQLSSSVASPKFTPLPNVSLTPLRVRLVKPWCMKGQRGDLLPAPNCIAESRAHPS